jgi:hypothetical protein
MFCPRCGKAEQMPETYCRQCGLYLLDFSKPRRRESSPEEHFKANTVLSVMTIVASFTLSFLLFLILGFRSFTHPLIYATAGILIAIGGWHIQTLIRTLMLKKQWKRRDALSEIQAAPIETPTSFKPASTGKLLDQADFSDAIPASVTEHTTRHLGTRETSLHGKQN